MNFSILGDIISIETIASGRGIRELKRINRIYGKATWRKRIGVKTMKHKFLLCVENKGYEASLEIRKLYETLPDKEAERHKQVRIIDESGEDYLYPSSFFATVRLSVQTKGKILEKAA